MSGDITLRQGVERDARRLAEFNCALARETEALELDPEVVISGVHGMLQHPERGFYVVAEAGDAGVIGSLMITSEWSDWRDGHIWWVQSVYVTPPWRRRGVYRRLYDNVRERARALGTVRGMRLYVEGGNVNAQRTYRAMGMTPTSYLVFEEMLAAPGRSR